MAEPKVVKLSSKAFVLSGHTAVVMVEGVSGCVALDAITRSLRSGYVAKDSQEKS